MRWLQLIAVLVLFNALIIASTSNSLASSPSNQHNSNPKGGTLNDGSNEKVAYLSPDQVQTAGEARWMASYYFPIFPQFYNLNYNAVWNFLKRADTIGYFVIRDVISVS